MLPKEHVSVTGSVLSRPSFRFRVRISSPSSNSNFESESEFELEHDSESESSILRDQKAPPPGYSKLLGDMVLEPFFRYSKRVSKMRLRSRVFDSKMDSKTNSKRKNTTENRYRSRTSFFHRFVIAWGLENGSPEPH